MSKKIAVTTSSFGKEHETAWQGFRKKGFEVVFNPHGRSLKDEEIVPLIKDCAGVIAGTENYSSAVIRHLPQLKVISRCGVGMDNIDPAAAKEHKVKLYNTPEGPTLAVAELVIGLMLALLRNISLMDREVRQGVWSKKMGFLLNGKNVGIIGFGRIGQAVAKLSKALGANVFYSDPNIKKSPLAGVKSLTFKHILQECDILTVHVPYNEQTKGLLGAQAFAQMKQDNFLINCSRGGIVNEFELHKALKEKRLRGAALDVFDQEPYQGPLKEFSNVILTPHIGSYAYEARVSMEQEAVQNLVKGLKEAKIF